MNRSKIQFGLRPLERVSHTNQFRFSVGLIFENYLFFRKTLDITMADKRRKMGGGGSSNGFQSLGLSDPVYGGIIRMGFRVRNELLFRRDKKCLSVVSARHAINPHRCHFCFSFY
jgi:hypothetical protein